MWTVSPEPLNRLTWNLKFGVVGWLSRSTPSFSKIGNGIVGDLAWNDHLVIEWHCMKMVIPLFLTPCTCNFMCVFSFSLHVCIDRVELKHFSCNKHCLNSKTYVEERVYVTFSLHLFSFFWTPCSAVGQNNFVLQVYIFLKHRVLLTQSKLIHFNWCKE